MDFFNVLYSKKAQMKIQQMAFMLVALMIFFGMVAIVYFTISFSSLKEKAEELRVEEAKELARKMSATPELMFSARSSCSSCLDFEKAVKLSEIAEYNQKYWNIDYLAIERIYPPPSSETCTTSNYLDCRFLSVIDRAQGNYSGTQTSPVSLVFWDPNIIPNGGYRYELGRVHVLAHVSK